jgi:hypothetical protein
MARRMRSAARCPDGSSVEADVDVLGHRQPGIEREALNTTPNP